jgi:hypothetical protein
MQVLKVDRRHTKEDSGQNTADGFACSCVFVAEAIHNCVVLSHAAALLLHPKISTFSIIIILLPR